jgi:hypothetical protein
MDNLVLCPCGHTLAHHDYEGCAGDRLRRCTCPYERHAALEAAVESVRTTPVYTPSYLTLPGDAA